MRRKTFWEMGQIALIAAIASFIGAGTSFIGAGAMLILSVLGLWHLNRVSP